MKLCCYLGLKTKKHKSSWLQRGNPWLTQLGKSRHELVLFVPGVLSMASKFYFLLALKSLLMASFSSRHIQGGHCPGPAIVGTPSPWGAWGKGSPVSGPSLLRRPQAHAQLRRRRKVRPDYTSRKWETGGSPKGMCVPRPEERVQMGCTGPAVLSFSHPITFSSTASRQQKAAGKCHMLACHPHVQMHVSASPAVISGPGTRFGQQTEPQ